MKKYIYRLLVAIDQLGNAIAGGIPDGTISARTGYFATNTKSKFWKLAEKAIDFVFFPLDGPRHCWQAYTADQDENYRQGSNSHPDIINCSAANRDNY